MTAVLPPLYHWSPSERRMEIMTNGLRTYSKPTVTSGRVRLPYICLGFTPSGAWGLSGDFLRDRENQDEIEDWDLWQVNVPELAEVQIRSEFGPRMQEVKVFTAIPPDQLWWVAQRSPLSAIEES